MHSVSQKPNLRHLGEPLGGAESLLEAVSFKKVTEDKYKLDLEYSPLDGSHLIVLIRS